MHSAKFNDDKWRQSEICPLLNQWLNTTYRPTTDCRTVEGQSLDGKPDGDTKRLGSIAWKTSSSWEVTAPKNSFFGIGVEGAGVGSSVGQNFTSNIRYCYQVYKMEVIKQGRAERTAQVQPKQETRSFNIVAKGGQTFSHITIQLQAYPTRQQTDKAKVELLWNFYMDWKFKSGYA